MTRFLPALALTAGLAATPAFATDIEAMSDDERNVFRDEVRAYLLENPEVIMEAVAVLERRDAAAKVANDSALIATHSEEILNDGVSHVTGNLEGDITFVEFVDYKCGYCRKAFPELKELVETDGNIRVIYKEFPILGDESLLASRFAISAQQVAGQEAYSQVHDALMTMRGNVTPETLSGIASDLDLDGDAILAGMNAAEVDEILGANHALAAQLQISGTPTFVIEDQMLRGYVPLDGMTQIVAELREAKN